MRAGPSRAGPRAARRAAVLGPAPCGPRGGSLRAMPAIELGTVELGGPRAAIIVPLTGVDDTQLLAEADEAAASRADVVEWRVDLLDDPAPARAVRLAPQVSAHADRPLLATVRTVVEGGGFDSCFVEYGRLVGALAEAEGVGLVDVECARPGADELIGAVHAAGRLVVGSNHEVSLTPDTGTMVAVLRSQAELGADVCKLAVTARTPADTARLLEATALAHAELDRPIISMAMGPLGLVSRVMGQDFGSAAGFGSLGGRSSAPGQVPVDELVDVMGRLDRLRRVPGPRRASA